MSVRAWLVAAVVVPRLALLAVNQNLGGDAIARTLLAQRWLEDPRWMTSFADGGRQFGPLHLYLLALAQWLWPSLEHAGRVVSLVAGTLTAWPLYVFTARRFGPRAAQLAVLALAAWGLHVQCSTTAASEALNLLLVMGAVALFDVAGARRAAWWGAALLLNLACATRYDSWLLVPLLAGAEAWRSARLLRGVAFGAAASVFAVSWLAGECLALGDPLYSIRFIDQFHRAWWPAEAAHWGEGWYRLACAVFWPGAALVMLTPLLAGPGLASLGRLWREQRELRWLAVLLVAPALLYGLRGALFGSFAPLARFTAKEVLLLLPLVGWALDRASRGVAWAALGVLAAWSLALGLMTWEPDGWVARSLRPISPVSRLEEPLRSTARWLRTEAAPRGGLLVVEADPRGYDELPLSYFSGFPFSDQLRTRYERFDEALAGRHPRWLVVFNDGADPTIDFRGGRFVLRRPGPAAVYERAD